MPGKKIQVIPHINPVCFLSKLLKIDVPNRSPVHVVSLIRRGTPSNPPHGLVPGGYRNLSRYCTRIPRPLVPILTLLLVACQSFPTLRTLLYLYNWSFLPSFPSTTPCGSPAVSTVFPFITPALMRYPCYHLYLPFLFYLSPLYICIAQSCFPLSIVPIK